MQNYTSKKSIFFIILVLQSLFLFSQETIVNGVLKDAVTKEPLPFANVFFTGTTIGTITNIDGQYELTTTEKVDSITFNFLGYKNYTEVIKLHEKQRIVAKLESSSVTINEVKIVAKRKVKKDTAAITLFRRIVKNKNKNSIEQFDTYQYDKYAKTRFDIYNYKGKMQKKKILKPFEFVFENVDTTAEGVAFLPLLLKESISDVKYRKSPKKKREVLYADKFSGFKDVLNLKVVDEIFFDIDVYADVITIQDKAFMGPFSKTGLANYKYFIKDTLQINGDQYFTLEFTARRKGDLSFSGFAIVHDSTAAISSIGMQMLGNANLNYVTELAVKQDFDYVDRKQWFKSKEIFTVSLNLTENKKNRSIRVTRQAFNKNIIINEEIPDSLLAGESYFVADSAYKRQKDYFDEHRLAELEGNETQIYQTVERVQNTKAFKAVNWVGNWLASGFMRFGNLDIGPFYQFYSWNELEGKRIKFGMRTGKFAFKRKLNLEGYGAYGTKDELFKYYGSARYKIGGVNNLWHQIGAHHKYDWSDFNQNNPWLTYDHIFVTLLRRNPLDNLFLMRETNLYHEKEWTKGVITTVSAKQKNIYTWPGSFEINDGTNKKQIRITEFNTRLQIGKDVEYREINGFRFAKKAEKPLLIIDYTYAPKDVLESDFDYHKVKLSLQQNVSSLLGRTLYEVEAGKIFGTVPYPGLYVPAGNEAFFYNRRKFNMMNEFEFVMDEWVQASLEHRFEGLLFNAIPLVRKLKWRTVVGTKAIYGGLSDSNSSFLTNSDIKPLDGLYWETSVGIDNIFKLARIDFMWRITQRDDPAARQFGIKFEIFPRF